MELVLTPLGWAVMTTAWLVLGGVALFLLWHAPMYPLLEGVSPNLVIRYQRVAVVLLGPIALVVAAVIVVLGFFGAFRDKAH